MSIRRLFSAFVICLSVALLAMPYAAEARCKSHCGYCKGGVIYNETSGKFNYVSSNRSGMVYRSVDGRFIPVGKMGSRYSKSCHNPVVGVRCQTRPGYWWGYTWFAPSNECWYIVR